MRSFNTYFETFYDEVKLWWITSYTEMYLLTEGPS